MSSQTASRQQAPQAPKAMHQDLPLGTMPLLTLCVASTASYLALEQLGVAHPVAVAASFLVLPVVTLQGLGRPLGLGGLDRTFLLCLLPLFAGLAVRLPRVVADPWSVAHLGWGLFGPSPLTYLLSATATVVPVDLFLRRVVQWEAQARWGARIGVVVATVAWVVGHTREHLVYLVPRVGHVESLVYLSVTGLAGALAYARWRNLWGLMVGHVLLNVVLGVVAWHLL